MTKLFSICNCKTQHTTKIDNVQVLGWSNRYWWSKPPLCLPKKEWLIPLKSLVNKFHLFNSALLACLINKLISDNLYLILDRINHFIAIFYPSSIPHMTLPVILLKMVLDDSSCPLTDTKNRWLGWGVGCVGM